MFNISRDAIDFNKEILFGEIGALIGAQLVSHISKGMAASDRTISFFVVIGSIIGAAIFWLATRIYDQERDHEFTTKGLMNDIAYFTPVAFILTLILYYPTLYFFSEYLLSHYTGLAILVIMAQSIAFLLLLAGLNFYRYLLFKYKGKVL